MKTQKNRYTKTENVSIIHKCGHEATRSFCLYSACIKTIGNFKHQLIKKISYFENLECLNCRVKLNENTQGGGHNRTL